MDRGLARGAGSRKKQDLGARAMLRAWTSTVLRRAIRNACPHCERSPQKSTPAVNLTKFGNREVDTFG